MTCRDDLLTVIGTLVADRPDGTFWLSEVIERMHAAAHPYPDTTIRAVLTQRMCVNARQPGHGAYADVERLARARYRLLTPISRPPDDQG